MNCGIYAIRNIINDKLYIGSSIDIRIRWERHVRELNNNSHHNIHLQRAWNKYEESKFEFIVLEHIDDTSNLFIKEQYWIDMLNPAYNIGSVGGGDCVSKSPKNKAFREKQSIIQKERYSNMTPTERKKLSEKVKGKKNANWRGGKTFFKCPKCGHERRVSTIPKVCIKCRDISGTNNPFYGKKHNKETLEKLSKKLTGLKGPGSKKIVINGIEYPSHIAAANAIGCSHSMIGWRLKKGIYTANGPNFIDGNGS